MNCPKNWYLCWVVGRCLCGDGHRCADCYPPNGPEPEGNILLDDYTAAWWLVAAEDGGEYAEALYRWANDKEEFMALSPAKQAAEVRRAEAAARSLG